MGSSSSVEKLACVLAVLCMALTIISPHVAEAAAPMTCGGVTKSLAPCMAYLKGTGGPTPPTSCCSGVRALKGVARTPTDRKTACNCMKDAARRINGLNYGIAQRLPTQCGVRISYTFNPNTNCNTVQ